MIKHSYLTSADHFCFWKIIIEYFEHFSSLFCLSGQKVAVNLQNKNQFWDSSEISSQSSLNLSLTVIACT